MIREIRLQNFKCFVDKKIDFNQMTILAGSNAAGKSSIIQSILLQEEACVRNQGNLIDGISMMGNPIGSLRGLISHNRKDLSEGDIHINIEHDRYSENVVYTLNKDNVITLSVKVKSERELERDRIIYIQAERIGARTTYPARGEGVFLPDGSNAPFISSIAENQGRKVNPFVALAGEDAYLGKQFAYWMSEILGETNVSVDTDAMKATTDIMYKNVVADDWVSPPMTGFGISYVEPIIVAGLWCSLEEKNILIIENPEAHLHPSAQSKIGQFLMLVALSGVQIILETHSEHVIDGIRLQAAFSQKTDEVNTLFFKINKESGEIDTEKIIVHENGELDKWPEGFFDQKARDLSEIFKLRKR